MYYTRMSATNLQQEHCIMHAFTTNLQQGQCMINMFSLNLQQEHYYTHLPQTCNKKTVLLLLLFVTCLPHLCKKHTMLYTPLP